MQIILSIYLFTCLQISDIVDSIVLNLGSWLGVPSLPIVVSYMTIMLKADILLIKKYNIMYFPHSQLLHRQLQNSALTAFESDPILSRRLHSLSLWTSLQALGRDAIAERIHVAFQTCSILFEITSKCEGMRVVVSCGRRKVLLVVALNFTHILLFVCRYLSWNGLRKRVNVCFTNCSYRHCLCEKHNYKAIVFGLNQKCC